MVIFPRTIYFCRAGLVLSFFFISLVSFMAHSSHLSFAFLSNFFHWLKMFLLHSGKFSQRHFFILSPFLIFSAYFFTSSRIDMSLPIACLMVISTVRLKTPRSLSYTSPFVFYLVYFLFALSCVKNISYLPAVKQRYI